MNKWKFTVESENLLGVGGKYIYHIYFFSTYTHMFILAVFKHLVTLQLLIQTCFYNCGPVCMYFLLDIVPLALLLQFLTTKKEQKMFA